METHATTALLAASTALPRNGVVQHKIPRRCEGGAHVCRHTGTIRRQVLPLPAKEDRRQRKILTQESAGSRKRPRPKVMKYMQVTVRRYDRMSRLRTTVESYDLRIRRSVPGCQIVCY